MKMKHLLPLCVLSLLVIPLGHAAKPDAPAGPKPFASDGVNKKDADKAREKAEEAKAEAEKTKAETEKKAAEAKEKEKEKAELEGKKSDKERKELGKGSEQGQTKRAEHSRKWWKFWGKDEE